jgi:hypothetical protein
MPLTFADAIGPLNPSEIEETTPIAINFHLRNSACAFCDSMISVRNVCNSVTGSIGDVACGNESHRFFRRQAKSTWHPSRSGAGAPVYKLNASKITGT